MGRVRLQRRPSLCVVVAYIEPVNSLATFDDADKPLLPMTAL
jgi:hypothetical protein